MQIDQAKLELEISKLAETIRHNRRSERQETQRIVLEQAKLSKDWAKLKFDMRAKIVELALEERKLDQKDIELQQKAESILTDKFVAVTDFGLDLQNAKNKWSVEYAKVYKDMLGAIGNAFGGKAVGLAAGELRGMIAGSEYDDFIKSVKEQFPQYAKDIDFSIGSNTQTGIKEYDEQFGPQASDKFKQDLKNRGIETGLPGSSSDRVIGFTGTQDENVNANSNQRTSNGTSVQKGKSGADYYSNHREAGSTRGPVETKSNSGTSVIYSGGSHYGPGF